MLKAFACPKGGGKYEFNDFMLVMEPKGWTVNEFNEQSTALVYAVLDFESNEDLGGYKFTPVPGENKKDPQRVVLKVDEIISALSSVFKPDDTVKFSIDNDDKMMCHIAGKLDTIDIPLNDESASQGNTSEPVFTKKGKDIFVYDGDVENDETKLDTRFEINATELKKVFSASKLIGVDYYMFSVSKKGGVVCKIGDEKNPSTPRAKLSFSTAEVKKVPKNGTEFTMGDGFQSIFSSLTGRLVVDMKQDDLVIVTYDLPYCEVFYMLAPRVSTD